MKVTYAVLIALLVAGLPAWAAAAVAAPTSGQSTYSIMWKGDTTRMVQGKVVSLSPDGNTVALTDGVTLTVAKNLSTEPLMRGDEITAIYKQDGGKNIMTSFWVDSGRA